MKIKVTKEDMDAALRQAWLDGYDAAIATLSDVRDQTYEAQVKGGYTISIHALKMGKP